ncbi:Hypothetical predicted protein [Paramuricea clavata]|uniref:Uncharacterized protein n=1 Tax=Paramuricea clavata TaxID=317549 RepID=A0A6S7I646_PARCT|nr:Hypothetical predicted protein [Paramuricea clavata]
MASRRKSVPVLNYNELNNLSSEIIFKTGRKPKGKFFSVERIISRRKVAHSWEYLVKWTGWPLETCNWEPFDHLTPTLLRSYDHPPKPEQKRIEQSSRNFFEAISKCLKSKSVLSTDANIDLDVQRWMWQGKGIASEHKGYKLYNLHDFCNLDLPETWWYYLDHHGEGKALNFRIKMKSILSWTPKRFIFEDGQLKQAKRLPIIRVKIHFCKRACNVETL